MKIYLLPILNFLTKYICELIFLVCIYFSFQFQAQYNNCEKIIKADGLGYYSYLPAIFIYNDYNFSFTKDISNKYEHMNFGDGFLKETSEGKVNKYYFGLSILWLPFFLIVHLLAIIFGLSADGYSIIYQISVLVAANFYLWLGCKYLFKLILEYSIPKYVAAFIISLIVFGTNLFFYVTFDESHTHAYSFSIISLFLFSVYSFFKFKIIKHLYLSAFLLGIIVLLRPSNLVIATMFLFFAGSYQNFREIILNYKKELFISIIIFLVALFPQFLLYYLQSGKFMVWSYGDEKFYFSNPHIFDVLFSYRKGIFIYTPLVFFSLFGLFYLYTNNKFQFIVLLVFLFVSTYIISSWWCWWYGASLGQRAFVDYYAVLGLLFSFFYLSFKKNYQKWIFFSSTSVLAFYSLILSYQYRNSIIDWGDMNKQKYWFTFLKTDKSIEGLAFFNDLFSGIETANIVNIKASNNKYLSSGRDSLNHVFANADNALLWEAFNMIFLDNHKIAFRSDDGKYISTRLDYGNILTHVADEINECGKFEMFPIAKDSFLLKAYNGKFVVLNGEILSANSDNITDAEHFLLIKK